MKRRAFLKTLAAGGILAGSALRLDAYARRKPTMTVITDIDPATPLIQLRAMLGGMLAKGLPVSCIVRTRAADGTLLRQDSPLAVMMRDFMALAPGLLEIIAHAPDLAGQTPHFQARMAYKARTELVEALIPDGDLRDMGPLLLSLACQPSDRPLSPEGARSAGIRNILVLPQGSEAVTTETWGNGILRVFGGVRGDLYAAVESLGLPAPRQFQNVILLSVRENADRPEHLITAAARVYANVALQHEADQWTTNLRLCDLQLRDGFFSFSRDLALHLFAPGPGQKALLPGFQAFQAELAARDMPFSVGPAPASSRQPGVPGQGYWIATETLPPRRPPLPAGSNPETLVALDCDRAPVPLDPNQPFVDAGVGLILDPRAGGIQGVDDCGRLHIPVFPVTAADAARPRLLSGADGLRDLVITVSPEILATRAMRSALHAELGKLSKDWITSVVPVSGLVRPIAPRAHLISLYRQTEAYQPRIAPAERDLSDADKDLLLENAVMAWSYFYRFTNSATGLCPATVKFIYGESKIHHSVTMWDVGSHLNALMAAVDLDIITEKEFRRNVGNILTNIAGRTSGGRTLPSEWVRIDRARYGNRNFDGSDAGRLLAALWNLSRHRFGDDRPEKLVKSWDLEKVIVDGRIHSVHQGKLDSSYESHSAHYAARAFRNWGFDVDSPYEVFGARADSDDRIRLLEAAAAIGPLGAEPLLLEAMDFGLSRESAYLADVLYGAQLREFDNTRRLVCASEGPIDRAPWFTYQGLQFDAPDRTWVIDTTATIREFEDKAFQDERPGHQLQGRLPVGGPVSSPVLGHAGLLRAQERENHDRLRFQHLHQDRPADAELLGHQHQRDHSSGRGENAAQHQVGMTQIKDGARRTVARCRPGTDHAGERS